MIPAAPFRHAPRAAAIGILVLLGIGVLCGPVPDALPAPGTATAREAESDAPIRALMRDGRLAEAGVAVREHLSQVEEETGESLQTARLLDLLVEIELLSGRGGHSEALDAARRAVAIKEGAAAGNPVETSISLNNLARVLHARGHASAANRHYQYLVATRERRLGKDSPDLASSLTALAVSMMETGDAPAAGPLLERALAIQEKTLGPDSQAAARTLNALALKEAVLGDREAARTHYRKAMTILESRLSPERLAVMSDAVGTLLTRTGDYEEAGPYFEQALALWTDAGGPAVFSGRCEAHLAFAQRQKGKLEQARIHYERALAVLDGAPDADPGELATLLSNLSEVLLTQGDDDRARPLAERSRDLFAQATESPEAALAWERLGWTLSRAGDKAEALKLALDAVGVSRENLRRTAYALPERQAVEAASLKEAGLDLALSLAGNGLSPSSNREVCDALIRSRALVLDELAIRYRTVYDMANPGVAKLYDDFTAANATYSSLLVREGGNGADMDAVRRKREDAEAALAARSLIFRMERLKNRAGWDDVHRSLPPRSGLLMYAAYDTGPENGAPSSYLAFLMRSDSETPVAVSIGSAAEVDALVSDWGREAAGGAGGGSPPSETAYRKAGAALRTAIWDPVAPFMDGLDRVFIVPDGALNFVSFASLPSGGSRYLVETGPLLHYLSAERDLVAMPGAPSTAHGLLALGGAAYDASVNDAPAGAGAPSWTSPHPYRGEHSQCESFRSLRFEDLPASKEEIDTIIGLWPGDAVRLSGAGASEAAFKRLAGGKKLLHLATHAFFVDADCSPGLPGTRGLGRLASDTPLPEDAENPLVLSGLALAGANQRSQAGPGDEDGILTAEEIATLDLSGVEWAVLSGCDTGLGTVRRGEGVFGLRRAFEVAGVRTLFMSLWPVEDDAARAWMLDLYRARLVDKLDTAASARRASLEILEARRGNGESTHPFYWAAFVATGDWH